MGPYRGAGSEACPACATPLAVADVGELRPCPQGCGEWASAAAIGERWGAVVEQPRGDARWLTRPSLPCVVCRKAMLKLAGAPWVMHRCREHGAWFAAGARARLEQAESGAIATHVAHLRDVRALAARLIAAIAGEPDAALAVAQRVLAAEQRVSDLEAQVGALARELARLRSGQ